MLKIRATLYVVLFVCSVSWLFLLASVPMQVIDRKDSSLVSEMTYVLMWTLKPTHSLTHPQCVCVLCLALTMIYISIHVCVICFIKAY